ncbi:outer membrane beta-barrel protein [Christiangramia sp. SM2212]|uniref:Outer membrane beta-barrel protein n=1 Tax=Christiangramia sediminicola TaxID=3073267 RepID=A0ABU1ELH0_9FLAO|nr:outer membrane beta-barrel protein [Christiangramia sp. SM2212]MDR5589226.1 outer membrane beta-barrel protein [Christiangramia sp. SM2212]
MKNLLCVLTLLLSYAASAQVIFESGYIINNSGERREVQIKNKDWRSNPTEFTYRNGENSEEKIIGIKNVKEFGIDNYAKFIRANVDIDRSSERLSDLKKNNAPVMKQEELFLKTLIEGDANLYLYKDGGLDRFFYKLPDEEITQLVWKKYLTPDGNVAENNQYKQDIWNNLRCDGISMSQLENLEYDQRSLYNFFEKYNECKNADYKDYRPQVKRDLFNLNIRPRLNNSSLSISNPSSSLRSTDFDNETSFGIGLEAELILPFNKNKWSVFVEPTYQSYSTTTTTEVETVSGGQLNSEVDYSSIELPIGVRHYFFLNENSKIFANIAYVIDFSNESEIKFTRAFNGSSFDELEIESEPNYALGLGYKHNDRFSMELRYQTSRELLGQFTQWKSEYKTFSVILGYSFF